MTKQLLSALKFANEKQIIHQGLTGYQILLDGDRSIRVCGWGNSGKENNATLMRKMIFGIGEIILLMMTGHPPFLRHNNNDQLYKLISEKTIDKFWQIISKRTENKIPDQVV